MVSVPVWLLVLMGLGDIAGMVITVGMLVWMLKFAKSISM